MTNIEICEKLKTINIYKTKLMIFLKNHHPDIYQAVFDNTDFLDQDKATFSERLYCVKNDIRERVKCAVCGSYVKFNNDACCYYKTCSTKCSRKNPETLEKYRRTISKKEDPMNIEKARQTRYAKNGGKWHAGDFRSKTEHTLTEKYGDPHWNNPEKFRKTSLENNGVDHPMKCDAVKQKQKNSIHEIYGTDCIFKLGRVRKNSSVGRRRRAWRQILNSNDVLPVTGESEFMDIRNINEDNCIAFKCRKCGKKFTGNWDNGHTRPCPHCSNFGHGTSNQEHELFEFLKNACGKKYKIYSKSRINRQIIPPKEIDIVVADQNDNIKFGIEYDGLYWHSDANNRKTSCLDKTAECESRNIRLIHIFENEWLSKKEIIKSRLKNMLGIFDNTIYARKCIIKEIDPAMSRNFQNDNHMQGFVNSSINIGLFYDNELISLMTFGKCRFDKKHEWELVRFCNKLGYHIPGAASRLLKYFEKNYCPKSLVTYADRRWSNGKLYFALNFKHCHNSPPNYWYFKNNDTRYIYSRVNFQKHKLKDKLKIFDESKSEVENMHNNGYSRIFDCGNMVFEKIY